MTPISDDYREQNRQLHDTNPHYGTSGAQWAAYIEQMVREHGFGSILDYGCGKGTLKQSLKVAAPVIEYDPAIEGKDARPEPADLVVCTDVLEHIEPDSLGALLRDLQRVTRRRLFIDVATRPAKKTLPDGRNAHLIVAESEWWESELSRWFDVASWQEREGFAYGELTPKALRVQNSPSRRRRLTPELSAFIEQVRQQTAQHSDAMSRIDSISVFEGVDDVAADMQIVCDILDPTDPLPQLRQALKLARKVMLVRAELGERTEAEWKEMLGSFLRIFDWTCEAGKFVCVGAPSLKVGGVKVVGARSSEERWEQVKAASLRFSQRITPMPAHGRTALLACYGPSLRNTIGPFREEMQQDRVDVVSVSGAHDYLIDQGITPLFHVECDPRAHKADNIAQANPRTLYLLGSGCHPTLFDKLEADKADIRLWHIATPEHMPLFFNDLKEPGNLIISGGGSVGVRAVSLLYALGYRRFAIHGMDCSFAPDGTQWAGKHAGKAHEVVNARIGDQAFLTSLVLLTYATDFLEMMQKVDVDCRLYGDGLLQAMAAEHARLARAA